MACDKKPRKTLKAMFYQIMSQMTWALFLLDWEVYWQKCFRKPPKILINKNYISLSSFSESPLFVSSPCRSSRCWLCRNDLRVSSPVVGSSASIMIAAHAVVLSRWWSMSSAGDGFRRGVGGVSHFFCWRSIQRIRACNSCVWKWVSSYC